MKKEITLVPKDKCPLDFIAKMGERTANAWIFLDASAYNKLLISDGCEVCTRKDDEGRILLKWEATDEYPRAEVLLNIPTPTGWGQIVYIEAENIAFTFAMADPKEIFFLKMAE